MFCSPSLLLMLMTFLFAEHIHTYTRAFAYPYAFNHLLIGTCERWQDTFSMSQHAIETKEFSCLGKLRKRNRLVKNVCTTSLSVTHHPRCQREILTRAIELRKNIPLLQRFQETGNEFSPFFRSRSLFLFFNLVLMVVILYARLLLSIECHSLSLITCCFVNWLVFSPRGIWQTSIAKHFLLAFMRSMNIWLSEFHLTDARLPLSCSVSLCVCVCVQRSERSHYLNDSSRLCKGRTNAVIVLFYSIEENCSMLLHGRKGLEIDKSNRCVCACLFLK